MYIVYQVWCGVTLLVFACWNLQVSVSRDHHWMAIHKVEHCLTVIQVFCDRESLQVGCDVFKENVFCDILVLNTEAGMIDVLDFECHLSYLYRHGNRKVVNSSIEFIEVEKELEVA